MRARATVLLAVSLLVASCGSGDETSETTTTAPAATTTTTVTTKTTTSEPSTTTTTEAPPPPFDTWTTILASLPTDQNTRADAAARLADLALQDGGVLLSDDYPSLNAGYWVVYSGVFINDVDAIARCAELSGIDCYHRYLGPATDTAPTLANGQYLAWLWGDYGIDLAAVDIATGAVVRTIAPGWAQGGIYPGNPQITTDGAQAYFDIGYEDSWFSCESTIGEFGVIDLDTADWDIAGAGFGPTLSPDGRYLAYATAERCLPDPEEPDFWFIAYHGTIVVRTLATGAERRWTPSTAVADTPAGQILGMGWSADGSSLYFSLDDARVRVLDPEADAGIATDALPKLRIDVPQALWVVPIGRLARAGRAVGGLLLRWADGPENDPVFRVGLFDPSSGLLETELASGAGWYGASLDASHTAILLWSDTAVESPTVTVKGTGRSISGADW